MSRALALLIIPLLALPGASALPLPVPGSGTEYVSSWSVWVNGAYCTAYESQLSTVEMPTFTTLTHKTQGASTSFALHVAPPVDSACTPFDLELVAGFAWPQGSDHAFTTACGMSGLMYAFDYGTGIYFRILVSVPAACDAGVVGNVDFSGWVSTLKPSPYEVCPPYSPIGSHCAGAYDGPNHPLHCAPGGQHTSVWPIFYAGDTCSWTGDDQRIVEVVLVVAVAGVRTTDSTCTLYVWDTFGLSGLDLEQDCPEAVRAPVHDAPWGELLP